MVGSSLASLLARSGVSLDFDLASVCQDLDSKQQLDDKTAEGYYMLWRCYSSRKGVQARISKARGHDDLGTPLMSLASSISLGQVCRIGNCNNLDEYAGGPQLHDRQPTST